MAAPIQYETLKQLPATSIFNNRRECDRFNHLIKLWKRDNPSVKAGSPQSLIAERYLMIHVLLQRLMDKRYFYDGTPTSFQPAGTPNEYTMSAEDSAQKQSEWNKYYGDLHRFQMDLLKLAMASNVSLNVSGELGSIHSLFGAMDQMERQKVKSFRNNGSNKAEEITDLIE